MDDVPVHHRAFEVIHCADPSPCEEFLHIGPINPDQYPGRKYARGVRLFDDVHPVGGRQPVSEKRAG